MNNINHESKYLIIENEKSKEIYDNFAHAKKGLINVLMEKIKGNKYYSMHSNQKAMVNFVESAHFDAFYEKFSVSISYFTEEDYESIGSTLPTPRTKELIECFESLDQNGFSLAQGNIINFWSGDEAKKRAWNDDSLSDSKIPAIAVGFDICRAIQQIENKKKYHIMARKLPNIVSAIFSSLAKDEVRVFISSNKQSEPASIIAGNNFFKAELPVVQRLASQNIVTKIFIYLQSKEGIWQHPVEFNSKEADCIPVVRRLPYKSGKVELDDKDSTPFVVIERWKDRNHFKNWCDTAPARPSITLGQLRSIARKFKKEKI